MKKARRRKLLKIFLIILAVAVAAFLAVTEFFGAGEITLVNSKSELDWKLGGTVLGITSPEDGEYIDLAPFVWFSEDGRNGLRSETTGTVYYMSVYPDNSAGKFCVTGLETTDEDLRVMDIRIGDTEDDAKHVLMKHHWHLTAGGLNCCRATLGSITLEIFFEHGAVSRITAQLTGR